VLKLSNEEMLLLGFAQARLLAPSGHDLFVEVDPEWFLQPLRDGLGSDSLARLMTEGAARSQDLAIVEKRNI
jgi:hypothetical protein